LAESNHHPLYQDVLENPGDDDARMVYSDWLTQNGDPRGEFIAIQCLLKRMDDVDPRLPELERRQNELLYKFRKDWQGWWKQKQRFDRGFLDVADCYNLRSQRIEAFQDINPGALRKGLVLRYANMMDRLFDEYPVSGVLDWLPCDGTHSDKIQKLAFLFPQVVDLFANAPQELPNLKSLSFATELYPNNQQLMIEKGRLDQLEFFGFQVSDINAFDLQVVSRLPVHAKIGTRCTPWYQQSQLGQFFKEIGTRELELDTAAYSWNSASQVVDGSEGLRLTKLTFRGINESNNPVLIRHLLKLGWARELQSLDIIGEHRWSLKSSIAPLEDCTVIRQIKNFELKTYADHKFQIKNWINPILNMDWVELRRLKVLASTAKWPKPGSNPIVALLNDPPEKLRRLELGYCLLMDEDFAAILKTKGIEQITHLSVRNNKLTSKSLKKLMDKGPWPNLVAIDLRNNSVDFSDVPECKDVFGTRFWGFGKSWTEEFGC